MLRTRCSNIVIDDTCDNISSIATKFDEDLIQILDDFAPEKIKVIKDCPPKPWISEVIIQVRKDYRKCVKVWSQSHTNTDWSSIKRARNAYGSLLKKEKKLYYSSKVLENKGNIKKLYNTINGLGKREKINPLPENRTDRELAEHFSSFFHNKVKKIADYLEQFPNYTPRKRDVPQLKNFKEIQPEDTLNIIKKLGLKQCELDTFLVQIVNDLKDIFATKLTSIINCSLREGSFPNTWKTALVKPLIKKVPLGPVDMNYRPVSNLKYFAKVLECAALKQIVEHCENNKLLPKYQSAYRKRFSCETMLIKLADWILNNMESMKITAVIALDLSAAFDTVNHSILLQTFQNYYGLNGTVLNWLASYLHKRSCKVIVNGSISEQREISLSVPQGGCSLAFYFIMYAATLFDEIPNHQDLFSFADDHTLSDYYNANSRVQEMNTLLELEDLLIDVREWMN